MLVASIILIAFSTVKPLLQDFTAIGLPQLPTRNGILRFRTVDLIITADQNRTSDLKDECRHGSPICPRAIVGACIEIFGFFTIVKTIAIELTFASFGLSDWTGQGVRSNKYQARSGQWQHHNIL